MEPPLLDFTYFDQATKTVGKIFSTESVDTIPAKLTEDEKQKRGEWAKVKKALMFHYKKTLSYEPICTKEQLLQTRIAAPVLTVENASARSSINDKRRKRVYPDALCEWEDFDGKVNAFSPTEVDTEQETVNPFGRSLSDTAACCNESEEGRYLKRFLLTPLEEMGLLEYMPNCKPAFVVGQPDAVMVKNSSTEAQVVACCEVIYSELAASR
jgi:hypothetical protein